MNKPNRVLQASGKIVKILGIAMIVGPLSLAGIVFAVLHFGGFRTQLELGIILLLVLPMVGLVAGPFVIIIGYAVAGWGTESKLGRRWFP